jgi:hypothetical protein
MKTLLLISIILVSFNCFSQTTKAQRYATYTSKCNTMETITVQESGYLKYDTLIVATNPTKTTYYGKFILNKVFIDNNKIWIVTVDTIWNTKPIPIYAYGNPPKTVIPVIYDKVYYRWVYRNRTISIKWCKPVTYTVWTKDEPYYEQLMNDIQSNIPYFK